MDDHPEKPAELTRTSRDREDLRRALTDWFADRLPVASPPEIIGLESSAANGMSSETVLFRVDWVDADGATHTEDLVARIAPGEADEPVFANYALDHQFALLAQVAQLTDVPVPRVRWLELDPNVIGTPFFIMDRVDGEIPPDNLPYTFGDNWLFDAAPEDQRRVQDRTVAVLATLHGIDEPTERFAYLAPDDPGDTPLARHVAHSRAWYDYAVSRASRSNLVEAGFAWLEAHWPQETSPVLLWGDARLGNVIYRDFEPAAVLDWEMASLGPCETDLGWMIFGHMVFDEIAAMLELPSMEHFMGTADIAATYERLTGHAPRDLHFYIVYAAVQWGIVFLRTGARMARFGEIEMPGDVDELMHHRALLTRLLET